MQYRTFKRHLPIIVLIALITIGTIGNIATWEIFFTVKFLFGSIATFVVLSLFGLSYSLLTAVLVSVSTAYLWNHPYALIVFTSEVLFVGTCVKRWPKAGMAIWDGLFWMTVGAGLIWLLYGNVLGLQPNEILLLHVKQAINGLFNVLVAELLVHQTSLAIWARVPSRRLVPTKSAVTQLIVTASTLAAIAVMIAHARYEHGLAERQIQKTIDSVALTLRLQLIAWREEHAGAVRALARAAAQENLQPSANLQTALATLTEALPSFRRMYVLNQNDRIISHYPKVIDGVTPGPELKRLKSSNIDQAKRADGLYVSPVITGLGGLEEPTVTIGMPIGQDGQLKGFAVGAVELNEIFELLQGIMTYDDVRLMILDQLGKPLVISAPDQQFSDLTYALNPHFNKLIAPIAAPFYRRVPDDDALPTLALWRDSFLGRRYKVHERLPWTLIVERAFTPAAESIYKQYTGSLLMIWAWMIFVLGASPILARRFAKPITELAEQSTDLPRKVFAGENLNWPNSRLIEVRHLVANFRSMTDALRGRVQEILATQRELQLNAGCLKEANQKLEGEVARRRKMEKQLRLSNRLKDEFLATVSHELRTPLNVIIGHATLLQHGTADETILKSVNTIARNAQMQTQLVNDLLDISQIISGRFNLKPNLIDMRHIINEVCSSFALAAAAKNITIFAPTEPQQCVVNGDATRLQQVMWNLLSNALKFTPADGSIWIELERNIGQAIVRVKDTGEGVAPEFLANMFGRFIQEDGSLTRRFGGLGLGLALVREIVELHGGTVKASSLGKSYGTTVEFSLPLVRKIEGRPHVSINASYDNDANPEASETNDLPVVDLANYRILLIEDNVDTRVLLRHLLKGRGAEVFQLPDTSEARQVILANKVNLIICDIGLPGESGYEFIRSWRSFEMAENLHPMKAIALTAYARAEDERLAGAAGFDQYVVKPVVMATFLKLLDRMKSSTPDQSSV